MKLGLQLSLLSTVALNSIVIFNSSPVLSLDFTSGILDTRITFSRPSLATMYDSTGKLTYCPNNLLIYSADFTQANWTKTNVSISGSTMTASAGNAAHRTSQNITVGTANYIFSVEAAAGTARYMQIYNGANTELYANFDLQTGTVGTAGTNTTASITDLGSGRYRCTAFWGGQLANGNNLIAFSSSSSAAWGPTVNAAGTETLTLYVAYLSAVTYETASRGVDRQTTTSAAYYGPRFDYNPSTLAARGLLIEEARTNSSLYSEDLSNAWWTKTGASVSGGNTAPDGTSNAYKLVEDTANSPHYIGRLAVVPATVSTVYTMSLYVKTAGRSRARFYIYGFNNYTGFLDFSTKSVVSYTGGTSPTVTFTDINNGYIRVTITDTATFAELQFDGIYLVSTGTTFFYTGDGTSGMILWGLSREAGSFATSYIPTGSSSVARSADTAYMGGTNFSSWYNQSEGTILAQYMFEGTPSAYPPVYSISDNAGFGANHIRVVKETRTNSASADMYSGGVAQASWTTTNTTTPFVPSKAAFAYKVNDTITSYNGVNNTADASCAVPVAPTYLNFGGYKSDAATGCLWIQSFSYYRSRLPNSRLQALTT